jgi:CTP synthase (UTP-ammonia lyase)
VCNLDEEAFMTVRIALIGDYHPQVKAHIAIPRALALAAEACGCEVAPVWLPTEEILPRLAAHFADCHGFWCVPASPYVSMEGALAAIRYAREQGKPYLGTCGGFQHALIEYARNVLGLAEADHAESNPQGNLSIIAPLSCALRERKEMIRLQPGSRMHQLYGTLEIEEEYNCGFGPNAALAHLFERPELRITGRNYEGDMRILELAEHPFFVATLFQPERRALQGERHPVVTAFVKAARDGMRSR